MAISGEYQANDAKSFKDCFVEVDLEANSSWAAIDSWSTEIQVSGEEVNTTQTYPFKGSAIVFAGVKGPATIQCTIVYTQGTDDAFYQIRKRFEDNDGPNFDIRFAPAGSASGNLMFTSSGGKLTACPPPSGAGDASSATVLTFTVQADSLATSQM